MFRLSVHVASCCRLDTLHARIRSAVVVGIIVVSPGFPKDASAHVLCDSFATMFVGSCCLSFLWLVSGRRLAVVAMLSISLLSLLVHRVARRVASWSALTIVSGSAALAMRRMLSSVASAGSSSCLGQVRSVATIAVSFVFVLVHVVSSRLRFCSCLRVDMVNCSVSVSVEEYLVLLK